MKWGRKKSSSPSSSSSHSSILSRVFPVSWLSKFRQKGADFEVNRSDKNSTNNKSWLSGQGMKFYSMDEDDAYWRLSFRQEERVESRKSTGGINPVWDRDFQFHAERFGRTEMDFPTRVEELKFNDMVSDIRKTKDREELRHKTGVSDPRKQGSTMEDYVIEEIKVKKVIRESHGRKTKQKKAYSPRTECKIRAIEEMKKARMRMKKKMELEAMEENVMEGKTVFDSFAVAKSSFDPKRDFRDSMIEMIRERGIFQHEDLEQLLACYLTLNCDEYHDVIVAVFREVWMEMNEAYIDRRIQNG